MLVLPAVVPRALQAEVVMLVPKLVETGEHTAAAGALLGRLAEVRAQTALEVEGSFLAHSAVFPSGTSVRLHVISVEHSVSH